MEERANPGVGVLHMATLATLSVIALVAVGTWQIYKAVAGSGSEVRAENPASEGVAQARTPFGGIDWQAPPVSAEASAEADAANDPDGISNIAENVASALLQSYALAQNGAYTPSEAERIAGDIGESLRANVSHQTYAAADLTTDADASYERMLVYRSDLREALEPLLANPGYELALFAAYIETRDAAYATQLTTTVANYQKAIVQAADIVVPADALGEHVGILNALSEFAATLEAMTAHADDAFATAALLQTYNTAEAHLMTSFNTLATYQKAKVI
ncbi:hypothetical protein A3C21_00305 [Candidatus Kaiserbacteria bacterium RIFCSPHIGHO2_02_FULL_59_21]|uniref:Uncharacterized protein n=1 Tax=Candidatus Kaiserbacteria bacterium RIFCSPHIGHO2_02_FULL_59_21 TaxID=1798500 RepID=A0A1F6E1V2_9BACT|nr:MAG: hypothetical protein A3C21_00305 [Candidatus Kaiserbacteria bacterium RIFCSPHIGHO2_02_FULL_59_21]OGG80342.1 MAG: hypothetical protein A2952_02740 [Candidatus Kaiserbacteria bacterium RIFCSPLOWO2_01_FULL_59_34]